MQIALVSSFPAITQQLTNLVKTTHFQIAWTANNGQEAVKLCTKVIPDLIIMDLVMSIMDGIAATRIIMQSTPCAILILTNSISSYPQMASAAIKAGAIDVLNTPGDDANNKILLTKIKAVCGLIEQRSDIFCRRIRYGSCDNSLPKNSDKIETNGLSIQCSLPTNNLHGNKNGAATSPNYLVAIGASTGGPSAVLSVLQQLTAAFPAPIVVVQHVEDQFVTGLVAWFDKQIALTVKIAQEQDRPQIGQVLIAGGSRHLVFSSKQTLRYIDQIGMLYCPSVDLFFESLAEHWPGKIIGVLLTGMGCDGANGLKKLKEKCHITIAQNEPSCVVYGMPKAAIELKAAEYVLAPDQIGFMLNRLVLMKNN